MTSRSSLMAADAWMWERRPKIRYETPWRADASSSPESEGSTKSVLIIGDLLAEEEVGEGMVERARLRAQFRSTFPCPTITTLGFLPVVLAASRAST